MRDSQIEELAKLDKNDLAYQVLDLKEKLERKTALVMTYAEGLKRFENGKSTDNTESLRRLRNSLEEISSSFSSIVKITVPQLTKTNLKLVELLELKENKIANLQQSIKVLKSKKPI
jgi:hypothetical protein